MDCMYIGTSSVYRPPNYDNLVHAKWNNSTWHALISLYKITCIYIHNYIYIVVACFLRLV